MIYRFECDGWSSYSKGIVLNFESDTTTRMNHHLCEGLDGKSYLRSLAIFGPNNSGKTNLISSIVSLKNIVRRGGGSFFYIENMDNNNKFNKEIRYNIVFSKRLHTYEYELIITPKSDEILSESAFLVSANGKELLYRRGKDEIEFDDSIEHKIEELNLDKSEVFLTKYHTNHIKDKISSNLIEKDEHLFNIFSWFMESLIVSRPETDQLHDFDIELLKKLLVHFDTGITSIVENDRMRQYETNIECFQFIHSGSTERFEMYEESDGTIKLIEYLSMLSNNDEDIVFVVDEFDRKLHTNSVIEFFKLFHQKINKNQQIIFTSHETSLISSNHFRSDQIYLIDKDEYGTSILFNLKDKGLITFNERDYLNGFYGFIPVFKEV